MEAELNETKQALEQMAQEKQQVENEKTADKAADNETIENLKEMISNLKISLEEAKKECVSAQRRLSLVSEEKKRIRTEMIELETTCGDFQKEAEAALIDYDKASEVLKAAEKERDHFRLQSEQRLRELSIRTSEVNGIKEKKEQLEKEMVKLSSEMKSEREAMSHQVS